MTSDRDGRSRRPSSCVATPTSADEGSTLTPYELLITETFARGFRRLRNRTVQSRIWKKVRVLETRPDAGKRLVSAEDRILGQL